MRSIIKSNGLENWKVIRVEDDSKAMTTIKLGVSLQDALSLCAYFCSEFIVPLLCYPEKDRKENFEGDFVENDFH